MTHIITPQLAASWGACWDFHSIESAAGQLAECTPGAIAAHPGIPAEAKLWVLCHALSTWNELAIPNLWTEPFPRAPTWYWPFAATIAARAAGDLGAIDLAIAHILELIGG